MKPQKLILKTTLVTRTVQLPNEEPRTMSALFPHSKTRTIATLYKSVGFPSLFFYELRRHNKASHTNDRGETVTYVIEEQKNGA